MKEKGIILHAKHAFMPNSLGYCGPDARGLILQHLEESRGGDALASTLKEFEAAYPFLKLIARNTGRGVFDYAVPEAYWIGNSLLERVPVQDFHKFSHTELAGRSPSEVKRVFEGARGRARPHHSFSVMSNYESSSVVDGPNLSNENRQKLSQLMDSCRISWGKVRSIGKKKLVVEYRPLVLEEGRVTLASPRAKRVDYNPEVKPFGSLKVGDTVSLHWNFACDVLSPRQLRNISKYTALDLASTNDLLAAHHER